MGIWGWGRRSCGWGPKSWDRGVGIKEVEVGGLESGELGSGKLGLGSAELWLGGGLGSKELGSGGWH